MVDIIMRQKRRSGASQNEDKNSSDTSGRFPRRPSQGTRVGSHFHHSFLCCCHSCLFCLPSSKWYARKCKAEIRDDEDTKATKCRSGNTSDLPPRTPSTKTDRSTPYSSPSTKVHWQAYSSNVTSPSATMVSGIHITSPSATLSSGTNLSPLTASSFRTPVPSPSYGTQGKAAKEPPQSRMVAFQNTLMAVDDAKPQAIVTPVSYSQASSHCESARPIYPANHSSMQSLIDFVMEGSSSSEADENEETMERDRPATPQEKKMGSAEATLEKTGPVSSNAFQHPLQLPPLLSSSLEAAEDQHSPSCSFRSALEILMEISAAERESASAVCSEDAAYWYQKLRQGNNDNGNTPIPIIDISNAVAIEGRISPISTHSQIEQRNSPSLSDGTDFDPSRESSKDHTISVATGRVFHDDESDGDQSLSSSEDAITSLSDDFTVVIIHDLNRRRSNLGQTPVSEARQEVSWMRSLFTAQSMAILFGIVSAAIAIALLLWWCPPSSDVCKWSPWKVGRPKYPPDTKNLNDPDDDLNPNRTTIKAPSLTNMMATVVNDKSSMTEQIAVSMASVDLSCPCCTDKILGDLAKQPLRMNLPSKGSPLRHAVTGKDSSKAMIQTANYHWWWIPGQEWDATARRSFSSRHQGRRRSHPDQQQQQQQQQQYKKKHIVRFSFIKLPAMFVRWRRKFQCIARCLAS